MRSEEEIRKRIEELEERIDKLDPSRWSSGLKLASYLGAIRALEWVIEGE